MGKQEGKLKRRKRQSQENNHFEMFGLPQTYYKGIVKVSFEPEKYTQSEREDQDEAQNTSTISSTITKPNKTTTTISITPVFNNDKQFYTACFINPYQIEDSDEQQKASHYKKIEQNTHQIDLPQILIPKPRRKSQFCAVCRFTYDDYLDHIQTILHKRCIHRSAFNADIHNLSKIINKKHNSYAGMVTRANRKKMDIQMKIVKAEAELGLQRNKRQRKMQSNQIRQIEQTEMETKKQHHLQTQAKSLNCQLD